MRRVVLVTVLAVVTAGSWSWGAGRDGPAVEAPPREGPPPEIRPEDGPPTPPRDEGHPPRWGPPRRGTFRPGIFGNVTDEEIEEILAFTAEHLPEVKAVLERLREESPERFRAYMRKWRFEVRQLRALRERDQAAFARALEERRLRLRAKHLADRARTAEDEAERARLRAQLHEVVGRLFDAELATRRAHIQRLEEKLKELQERLAQHRREKETVVKERVQNLLEAGSGEEDDGEPGPRGEADRDRRGTHSRSHGRARSEAGDADRRDEGGEI